MASIDWRESSTIQAAFYTAIGGWDTHGTVDISDPVGNLNAALKEFTDEMKDQGAWEDVTVVVLSDFGRTLTSNSQGSDHGRSPRLAVGNQIIVLIVPTAVRPLGNIPSI
jgi:uncharacterized protein (DUF1501 family)